MIVVVCATVTVLAAAAMLFFRYREQRGGVYPTKMLASTGFLATALASGALATRPGQMMLVAFGCCWLGDLLLIPRGRRFFWGGLGAFLIGHIAFAVSFLDRGVNQRWMFGAAIALLLVLNGVVLWLHPYVVGKTRAAVFAYLVVICAMMAVAIGAAGASGRWQLAAGALMFGASDLFVARERLVEPDFRNRLIGSPLYYGGQLLLAIAAG